VPSALAIHQEKEDILFAEGHGSEYGILKQAIGLAGIAT
jgi:hypothetical protein